jgi:hypothetical protein
MSGVSRELSVCVSSGVSHMRGRERAFDSRPIASGAGVSFVMHLLSGVADGSRPRGAA